VDALGIQEMPGERKTLSDIEGQELVVEYAKVLDSDFGGKYALMACSTWNGQRFTIATSAQNVVKAIALAVERDILTSRVTFKRVATRKSRKVWVLQ